MSKRAYTEEEIEWAIKQLKKKSPERADRDHAIKLLNTFGDFSNIVVEKIDQDKKSGNLKPSEAKN